MVFPPGGRILRRIRRAPTVAFSLTGRPEMFGIRDGRSTAATNRSWPAHEWERTRNRTAVASGATTRVPPGRLRQGRQNTGDSFHARKSERPTQCSAEPHPVRSTDAVEFHRTIPWWPFSFALGRRIGETDGVGSLITARSPPDGHVDGATSIGTVRAGRGPRRARPDWRARPPCRRGSTSPARTKVAVVGTVGQESPISCAATMLIRAHNRDAGPAGNWGTLDRLPAHQRASARRARASRHL